ncbi:hypothetical protein CW751_12755 [Brumimicrobium salinarum]|uniref:Uncharacterized protein n=1 Tax=Brumimicrobium salinarum TaxID=2058658 RepID=A0A2I0R037_9FLAO|nr:hypothetical protein [Brumimicrobium salinarum]PKR79946.1 hypothetical protein CW751_12755 [Brumimicrobium salinarum]
MCKTVFISKSTDKPINYPKIRNAYNQHVEGFDVTVDGEAVENRGFDSAQPPIFRERALKRREILGRETSEREKGRGRGLLKRKR